MREPEPPATLPRRYRDAPLPAYRFVPGLNAHPRRDPTGHSHGRPEPHAPPWEPDTWYRLKPYLNGVDLYNLAYWWESHEQFEALWLAAGRTGPPARFVQGLLQLAAANLNHHVGKRDTARSQAGAALDRIARSAAGSSFMGIDVARLTRDAHGWFHGTASAPALIHLEPWPPEPGPGRP